MRKIFTLLLLFAGLTVTAQQYNNEWINYNQTYYKFKVGKNGIFRIPKTVLDAAGIGNTSVEFFELWRNGQRIPFYPSVPAGQLPADGYLEFWAQMNDGKPDKAMYRDPAFQHTDANSLITDTSSYFLSINSNQSGFKYINVTNDVAGNSRPVEPYFMYTLGMYYKNRVNQGFAAVVGEYVYSSSYDKGEFTASTEINPTLPLNQNLTQMQTFAGGPNATMHFGAVGNALNPRTVKLRINGTDVLDTIMDYFNDVHTSLIIPTAMLTPATVAVQFNNTSLVGTDRMAVSYFSINYPRTFAFNNLQNFEFTLPGKPEGYFLNITNFNNGGVAPILYDMANGERFVGDIGVAGMVRFALPGTLTERKLVLVNSNTTNTTAVNSLTTRLFTRYNDVANQGNYIIVSNQLLYTGSNGNNPVVDYKNYRQSAVGGGYKVLIADVEELIDQFAFGIKKHPLSVRNFLRYARANFATPPQFAFLMGRGVTYYDYRNNQASADADRLNLVPTFGIPGSDNLLSAENVTDPVATTPIGRLSAVNGKEIEDYLEKLIEYEAVQKNSPNTLADRAWMKNVVHVTGSSDPYLGTVLCHYMGVYAQIVRDTLYGGAVTSFCKTSTNPVEQISSGRLENLFAEGMSFLTYFGHSSSTTLEFNIESPNSYNNQGKYPVFFVNGCNAGNFFTFNQQRLVSNETLSEKFTLAKQRGSIAFVASTHYGIVNYLNLYLTNLYNTISVTDYGGTLGHMNAAALQKMLVATGEHDFYARSHAEEITVHGDPAIRLNFQAKPDYIVEQSSIRIDPVFISVAEEFFKLRVAVTNIGRSGSDSITVEIKRQYPNGGGIETIFRGRIAAVDYKDSITMNVPIVSDRDKGTNKIIVFVDADLNVNEMAEDNNIASTEFVIYEDEARPIFPYNFSIVGTAPTKMYASTANPFSKEKEYAFEMDTTTLFNSGMKVTKSLVATGGILEFTPGIAYSDSTVYYWRVSPVPKPGEEYRWNTSSFLNANGTKEGYNQSHFYQHTESEITRMSLDSASRKWKFNPSLNEVFMRNGVFSTAATQAGDFEVVINGHADIRSVCGVSGLIINVLDPVTLKPWFNAETNQAGQYGSDVVCGANRRWSFQYNFLTLTDTAKRRSLIQFLDLIPNGHYIIIKNIWHHSGSNAYINTWKNDTTYFGSNNSIYHRLLQNGFTAVDSMYRNRSFIFFYRKGMPSEFTPQFVVSNGISDRINLDAKVYTADTLAYVNSPKFGPAKAWKEVIWSGESLENPTHDNPSVDVIGIDPNNVETRLYTLDRYTQNFDISSIDALQYPYLRLRLRNVDSIGLSPFQLKYWRAVYDPAPEGALAPNLFFETKDSLEVGEMLNFGIAFKNVSPYAFDSVKVKVTVLDKNNILDTIQMPKQKPVITGDTAIVRMSIDTKKYAGDNVLFVDVNPDNDQPEQYHFNNFLYRNFYARLDKTNPLLDVTFDGVHILNRDIVSARPHIQIKLKDEAKYLLLNDTALSVVQIKSPDGTIRTYNFDGDTLRFNPATSGTDNTATIDFNPAFLNATDMEGDEYELIVRGKDRSNNRAGEVEYRIQFRVISKPMISNLLNYPNPFSTSTAFVFTITGSEIPQNIKIQILTVTGKIVREITKDELGPLRIGRNITEFKWDGTDQYGQKLGNGVYIYRVVTTMNGKPMEKYRAQGDDTDKYFTNGYGKMYLMR